MVRRAWRRHKPAGPDAVHLGRAAALPVLDYVVRATAAPLPGPDMAGSRHRQRSSRNDAGGGQTLRCSRAFSYASHLRWRTVWNPAAPARGRRRAWRGGHRRH